MIVPEYTKPAHEFSPPAPESGFSPRAENSAAAPEHAKPAPENAKLPPEYDAACSYRPREKTLLRAIYMIPAAALSVVLFTRGGLIDPAYMAAYNGALHQTAGNAEAPGDNNGQESAAPTESTSAAAEESTAESTSAAETETETESLPAAPEYETWPLADGTLIITVYNNSFDIGAIDWNNYNYGDEFRILLKTEIPEGEFTGLELPSPLENEDTAGFSFAGWSVHVNAEFDIDYVRSEQESFTFAIGNALTAEDAERVPVDSDGIRRINIHAMWRAAETDDPRLPLVLDGVTYEAVTPYESEGYTYLAAFDPEEQPGKTFLGWYDEAGNKVDCLMYYEFFDYHYNEEGGYYDADFQNKIPVVLHSEWK
ncbi:MAG: hypothetical protein Q4E57_09200 [Eubacteriales bacterium]|nr:hypothetical protein [Eubacteriales bacterium]